jgi:hypothetical protein
MTPESALAVATQTKSPLLKVLDYQTWLSPAISVIHWLEMV